MWDIPLLIASALGYTAGFAWWFVDILLEEVIEIRRPCVDLAEEVEAVEQDLPWLYRDTNRNNTDMKTD